MCVFLRGRAEGVGPGRSHAPVFGREEDQELRRLRLIRRRLLENDVLDLHGRPDRTIGAELVRSNAVGGKAAMALRHGRGRGLGRALAFASLEAIAGPAHHRPLRHGCMYMDGNALRWHRGTCTLCATCALYVVRHVCVGRCAPRVRWTLCATCAPGGLSPLSDRWSGRGRGHPHACSSCSGQQPPLASVSEATAQSHAGHAADRPARADGAMQALTGVECL